MKIAHRIGAVAITAAVVLGGTTAAFAGSDGSEDGSSTGTDKIALLCAHQDEIVPRLTERQAKVTDRIATLTELRTKAKVDGRNKVADRIAKRITVLQTKLVKVETRITKAPAWIAEHCS